MAPIVDTGISGTTLEPVGGSSQPGSAIAQVLSAWLVARVLMALSFGAATLWQRVFNDGSTLRLNQGLLAWDGDWYRKIADAGYDGTELEAVRFFPLYPQLGRLAGLPFDDSRIGLVIVANVAAVAVLGLLWKLVVYETGDTRTAQRAVWLCALFPAAFVLGWAYSESLFLVAALACFYSLRTQRWWAAAFFGVAAALCRPLGVLLVLPALVEVGRWLIVWRNERTAAEPSPAATPTMTKTRLAGALLAIVAPVLGLAGFGVWVDLSGTGAWDDPFTEQGQFRGDQVDPFTRLVRGAGDLFGPEALGDGLHLPFALGFIALVVVVGRRWPMSYTVYAAAALVVSLAADNLNSLERYGLNAFPLILALASITRLPERYLAVLAISALGLVGLTTLAWTGTYVP